MAKVSIDAEALARLERKAAELDAFMASSKSFVAYRLRPDPSQQTAGHVDFVSDSLRDIFGVDTLYDFASWFAGIHPDDVERVMTRNAHCAQTGEPFSEIMRIWHPGKEEWRHIHAISNATLDDEGVPQHFCGVMTDVTELQQAQAQRESLATQLQQAQRMESLGTLASGIAHDFNNVLMGISGNAAVALTELEGSPTDHPAREALESVEAQVRSGAALTRQLLGYARRDAVEERVVDLRDVVEATVSTYARTRTNIQVSVNTPDAPLYVKLDPHAFEQVLLNLCVNAGDAMGDQGLLQVRLGHTTVPTPSGEAVHARLEVEDNGSGIEPELLSRIFEPFFTTKPRGRGTGLGLAMAYRIVRNFGGVLSVSSIVGTGTTFVAEIPTTSDTPKLATSASRPTIASTGTILLVDDEPAILQVVSRILAGRGFTVLQASSGDAAIAALDDGVSVDVAVVDMTMPGETGVEVVERLRAVRPNLPAILTSGFGRSTDLREVESLTAARFLAKPFSPDELFDQLGELDAKHSRSRDPQAF